MRRRCSSIDTTTRSGSQVRSSTECQGSQVISPSHRAEVDLFSRSWTALRAAVADTPDADFERPSGCVGRLARDLACHLVIDAQDA